MKYFRAVAVIVIIISAVGYLHAQATSFDPASIFSGGCSNINGAGQATAERVSAKNASKLRAILMSDARSGYQSTHGILGLLNLGFISAQATSNLCTDANSETEACQALSRAGGLGRILAP